MKKISEFIIDSKLENYLLNDLILGLECRMNRQPIVLGGLNEGLATFLNCADIVNKIYDYLTNNFNEDDVDNIPEDTVINLDVSECKSYCNNIEIILNYTSHNIEAGLLNVDKNGNVKMHIEINHFFNIEAEELQGIILHELLHGYEEFNRKNNNKPSLFSELSKEYYNAKLQLSNNSDDIRNIAVMKYFFNPKERRANFGRLEKDIKELIEKIDPNRNKRNHNIIKNKLKESNVWKRYFDFEKFLLQINNYSDKDLEYAYYYVVKNKNERSYDLMQHIEKIKRGEKDTNFKIIKSSKEIKKEAENLWKEFNKKFNQLFSKIYCEHILAKKEFGTSSYEQSGK